MNARALGYISRTKHKEIARQKHTTPDLKKGMKPNKEGSSSSDRGISVGYDFIFLKRGL